MALSRLVILGIFEENPNRAAIDAAIVVGGKQVPLPSLDMDFTDLFAQTAGIVHFSPGRYFILSTVKDRLVVRRSDREGIVQTWLVDGAPSATSAALAKATVKPAPSESWITHAEWSPDSEYILAAVAKRGVVHVFSMRDEHWTARVEAGVEGLTKAEWAPDSRSILCFSEWGVSVHS